jgi:hypothetical protein
MRRTQSISLTLHVHHALRALVRLTGHQNTSAFIADLITEKADAKLAPDWRERSDERKQEAR